jgi:ATP-dependent Lhr-like helicase
MAAPALNRFLPLVRAWFARRYGQPTDAQVQAWEHIARGEHVLVTAPTGSGKTLAAFLWTIDGLLSGRVESGITRTIYVSPLRALNNDVRRNLLAPLDELRDEMARAGLFPPPIQVVTRSADTPPDERDRMARRPPEILITTPESLNILLTSQRGRRMLATVRAVILDEVHAVAGTKRGVHLMTAVERLALLAGEVQRIALSATVRPHATVARWVGGRELVAAGKLRDRPVHVVDASGAKRYDLQVHFPGKADEALDPAEGATIWPCLTEALRETVRAHRSTLVFANSRRMVEKIARLVNDGEAHDLVVAHHGSLSREIRHEVEARLKQGMVRGIVATSSLELGIDIGSLEKVVIVQTPPSVASTVQRVGRAGHAVGATSVARFLPLVPRDALDSAVVARAVLDGSIEPIRPVRAPLDVLAQVIVSATAAESWPIDALYDAIRCADSYRDLSRTQFDLVIEMLAGRYSSGRVRELQPIVSVDRVRGTVSARPGAAMRVYMGGGTIPDRGYFRLRRSDSQAVVGELDEEFVWERAIGDTFTLGVQSWRIVDITHNDVFVLPAQRGAALAPFWRAEGRDRSFELSERIGLFLEEAERRLDEPAWQSGLTRDYCLSPATAGVVVTWLSRQRAIMGGRLPHRHRVVLERVQDPQGRGGESGYVLHTVWGGRVNRPLALALQAALVRAGACPQVMHDDDCIVLTEVRGLRASELFSIIAQDELVALLRAELERTGFFGARFREAAGRALLLPRAGFQRRTPLWLSRLRAKKLLNAVSQFEDFPLRLEVWRECLQDAFDIDALTRLLQEVRDGTVQADDVTTSSPSPFAASVTWRQTNQLMYEDDTPEVQSASALRSDLVREVALNAGLRPRIDPAVCRELEGKLHRTAPGWSPRSSRELLDHVVERVLLPVAQWTELLQCMERDGVGPLSTILDELSDRLIALASEASFVCAVELLARVGAIQPSALDEARWCDVRDPRQPLPPQARIAALHVLRTKRAHQQVSASDVVSDWLASYGPISRDEARRTLGMHPHDWDTAIQSLVEDGRVLVGELTVGSEAVEVCAGENFERLLRMQRAGARPALDPLPLGQWPCFLAKHHGIGGDRGGVEALRDAIDRLIGYPAGAELWESELLPARLRGYQTAWLDALLSETSLQWLGCGKRTIAFVTQSDRELVGTSRGKLSAEERALLDGIFPHPSARLGRGRDEAASPRDVWQSDGCAVAPGLEGACGA